MFGFIKKVFFTAITFFSSNLLNVNYLKCFSMKNQECKARTKIISVISNEPVFYPFSIKVKKCSGSCNGISDPYPKLCVPNIIKNINFNVFNLMSRINETRHIIWHETYKCICRLSASVCNSRQRWNEDKCRCECKESVDKGICDKGSTSCECECDKSCGIRECFDFKNCVCRNSIVSKSVEECTKIVDENKIYNETLNAIPLGATSSNDSLSDWTSCTPYIVLFGVFLVTSVIIGSVFLYFYWYQKKILFDSI